MEIKKKTVEHWRVKGTDLGYAVEFSLEPWDNGGRLTVGFDGRLFTYDWGNTGRPFREFITRCHNPYLTDKLFQWGGFEMLEPDIDALVAEVKKGILKARYERSVSKSQARDDWAGVKRSFRYVCDIEDIGCYQNEILGRYIGQDWYMGIPQKKTLLCERMYAALDVMMAALKQGEECDA